MRRRLAERALRRAEQLLDTFPATVLGVRRRPQSAQAMVEFLIIIPVLILLIFGAVQARDPIPPKMAVERRPFRPHAWAR